MSITFERGEAKTWPWGLSGAARVEPVYMIRDGVKQFVLNLVTPLSGDSARWIKYHKEKNQSEVDAAMKQLEENGGAYFKLYAIKPDPIEFIAWVKDNGYTWQVWGELLRENSPGHGIDFHGNLIERSAAFWFRIYDEALIKRIADLIKDMPQKPV